MLYATAVMTVLIVVFGEVLPKTIAIAYPDRVALVDRAGRRRSSSPCSGRWSHAVEAFVRDAAEAVRLRLGEREPGVSGAEELRGAVDILHREGEVARDQRDMFGGLLELEDVPVGDVMIHRTKMRTLDADLPPAELVREALASPYTRMPLWRGDPDNIIGILHIKDLFRAYSPRGGDVVQARAADIALDAWFIPDATTLPRPVAGVPAPQDPFGAGGRRIRRRARAHHARGHHRGDRRRHQRRARRRACRACASSSTAR